MRHTEKTDRKFINQTSMTYNLKALAIIDIAKNTSWLNDTLAPH